MGALRNELKDKATEYHQAEAARDVLAEVKNAPDLKPTVEAVDRSAPVIEAGVAIKRNSFSKLKAELTSASPELKPVGEAADRSAPLVEAGVKVRESPMVALQKEIADKKEEIAGFATTGGVKVVKEGVMGEIAAGASALKHVEEGADRSAPLIETGLSIKVSPMAEVKLELTSASPELKPVGEAADRSAPLIEAGVKVRPSPMPQLASELKRRTSERAGEDAVELS